MYFSYVLLIFDATHKLDVYSLLPSKWLYVVFPSLGHLRVKKVSRIKSTHASFHLTETVADYFEANNKESPLGYSWIKFIMCGFWFAILDCHTCRALVLNFPSVSLTSLSCAHLRVSGSPPLFVKRWTSLAVWRAVS